jgi:uncharacterized RDD family membrane protein YckC
MSGGGLTSGDPLGGEPERPPAADRPPPPDTADRPGSLWSGGAPGYTSPAPPGAGGPRPSVTAGPAGRPVLASWARRALALIVDGAIISAGALVLVLLLTALGFSADTDSGVVALVLFALVSVLAFTIVALLYAPLMMARTNGQTIGRQLTGIRVIRADGQPMTFGFAMLREVVVKALLVGVASSLTFGLAWLLDILWPLWDEENRALHDFVVNTRTIRT